MLRELVFNIGYLRGCEGNIKPMALIKDNE